MAAVAGRTTVAACASVTTSSKRARTGGRVVPVAAVAAIPASGTCTTGGTGDPGLSTGTADAGRATAATSRARSED